MFNGIEELVGKTPTLRLNRMFNGFQIYAKLEYFNPTMSIKDRAAFYMVESKLSRGELSRGDYIIEATSGNTGLGLCVAAMAHGLHFIAVLFDDVSPEKIQMLKNYGAFVIICDGRLQSNEKGGYVWTARHLANCFPKIHYINQFENADNPRAHFTSTGPEIWNELGDSIDIFINTIGTGGTISGVSHFLKEKKKSIKSIGVEPVGGIYYDFFYGNEMHYKDHLIHSISDNFISPNFDRKYVDDVVQIPDEESFSCCLELMREEGLCIGTSAGCTVGAIKELIRRGNITENTVTVCTFADSGLKYTDSIMNTDYLKAHELPYQLDENISEIQNLLVEHLKRQSVEVKIL